MRSGLSLLCALFGLVSFAQAQGTPPTFVTYPEATQTVAVGDRASFSATVTGSLPLTYQWFKDGTAITGATNSTLSFLAVAFSDGGVYRIDATNSAGTASSLGSLLSVIKRTQTIAFNAPTSSAPGSGVTLTATASSGLPVSFSIVSGSATLNGNVLTATSGSVVVRATQAGNTNYEAADSVDRTITFLTGGITPFITNPPQDQTVVLGTNVTFRATAIGTPQPTYQWQKDGADLTGATSNALTLVNVALADAGRYTLNATNSSGVATATATLTVQTLPIITTQPADVTVSAGNAATFKVGVTAVPEARYQWRKNGANISGATRDTLTFASAATTDAARYDVVVTNALGSATSAAANLVVNVRVFTGTYFGRFDETTTPNAGQFALLVRANRSATFIGRTTGNTSGIVVNGTIDLTGTFTFTTTSLGVASVATTLRGTVDEIAGTVTGTLTAGTARSNFTGTRAAGTDTVGNRAGFYAGAVLGTAAARGFAIVAPSGDALMVLTNTNGVDSARSTVSSAGAFSGTGTTGTTVNATFASNTMRGTVGAAPNTATLLGVIDTAAGAERLANVSVRTNTSNAAPLIVGFVITGTANKQVLIRAAGPALAAAPFNVAGALADPTLQIFRGSTAVAQNDDWGTPAANAAGITAASTRTGAFAFRAGSADAAISTSLQAGAYTAQIGGGNGIVLGEVYEDLATGETAGTRRLINVSARGQVAPGSPLIAGFVVSGTGPHRVLVRGIGQTIGNAPFNVPNTLANPQVTVFSGSTAVKTNDDWFRDADATLIRDTSTRVGAFALGAQSVDAAVLLYLAPGAYTAQVNGPTNANAANGTGIALVEVYEAP